MTDIRPEYGSEIERYALNHLDAKLRSGGEWADFNCKAHTDTKASARIRLGSEKGSGKVVCNSPGCPAAEPGMWLDKYAPECGLPDPPVKREIGQKPTGKKQRGSSRSGAWKVVAEYVYEDEDGRPYIKAVKRSNGEKKSFRQHLWRDDTQSWQENLKQADGTTAPPILYHLPELLGAPEGSTVLVLEGEKDVHKAESMGWVATTPPMGAPNADKTRDWTALRGRNVVIIPDNDEPGELQARLIADLVNPIAKSTRVLKLPGLPAKGDFSDWVSAGGTTGKLERLIRKTSPLPKAKPRVVVNGRDPEAIDREILDHLSDLQKLYSRADDVVTTGREPKNDALRIVSVSKDRMALEITQAMTLVNERVKNNDVSYLPCRPSAQITGAALVGGSLTFPPLVKLVDVPFFDRSGRLVHKPGYDEKTGVYYEPFDEDLNVNPKPTQEDVKASLRWLESFLLEDFYRWMESDTDRTHAVCATLQTFLAEYIAAPCPAYLFAADQPASGKTYLAQCIGRITIPSGAPELSESKTNEDEMRKNLDAKLIEGNLAILLDNIQSDLNQPWLQQYLTATQLEPRVLGKSKIVRMPNRHLWMITANTPKLFLDTTRRTVPVKFKLGDIDPASRAFKDQALIESVVAHRRQIVEACLTIIGGWMNAGAPEDPKAFLLSYSRWARVMGGLMSYIGKKGFLATQKSHLEEINEAALERREILEFLVSQAGLVRNEDSHFFFNVLDPRDMLPACVNTDRADKTQRRQLGAWLSKFARHTPRAGQYRLKRSQCKSLNKPVYSIEQIVKTPPGDPSRTLPGGLPEDSCLNGTEVNCSKALQGESSGCRSSGGSPGTSRGVSRSEPAQAEPSVAADSPGARELFPISDEKHTHNTHTHDTHVNNAYIGAIGESLPGLPVGNRTPAKSNARIQARLKELETSIRTNRLFGKPTDKLEAEVQRIRSLQERGEPESAPPPGPPPPEEREEFDLSDELGGLL